MSTPRSSRAQPAGNQAWEDVDDYAVRYLQRTNSSDRASYKSDGSTDVDIAESGEDATLPWKLDASEREYACRREISAATAIHLDLDRQSVSEDDEEGVSDPILPHIEVRYHHEDDDPFSDEADCEDHNSESRRPSGTETISTMPEEHIVHGRWQPEFKQDSPSQHRSQTRMLSTPARSTGNDRRFSSATPPTTRERFVSSPAARTLHSGFGAPTAGRAMYLSTPSPPSSPSPRFARSPRSARHRRLEEQVLRTSRLATPSQDIHSSQEHPLVLLHCSFNLVVPDHPTAVLNSVLPQWTQHNLSLLKEKVNKTVLERGALIPHPGEDFELLEERILESLELKRPRVGKCGHYLPHNAGGPAVDDVEELFDHAPPACETCSNRVHDDHRGCAGDTQSQRYNLKIYAANGLMRAGAWAAAWREMEKVDVEIGIWMPEAMRQRLEEESSNHEELWEQRGLDRVRELRMEMPYAPTPPPLFWDDHPETDDELQHEVEHHTRHAETKATPPPSLPTFQRHHTLSEPEEDPLSTLLIRFLWRNVWSNRVLQHLLVLTLAVVVFRRWGTSTAIASPATMVLGPLASEVAMTTVATTKSASAEVQMTTGIALCTFAAGEEGQSGMTALPAHLAKSVLDAVTSTAPIAGQGVPAASPIAAIASAAQEETSYFGNLVDAVLGEAIEMHED